MFCIPKAAVLHGKSVGFAAQNSRFRNAKAQLSLFNNIIFTKSQLKCRGSTRCLHHIYAAFSLVQERDESRPYVPVCIIISLNKQQLPHSFIHRNQANGISISQRFAGKTRCEEDCGH
ncbi:hypothetical protein CBG55_00730 [Prevotella intermedia]|uniref:Uncharacterized protein n=2 Tax=Prevotella intermedia TaxID=28131 RepID=A0A2M8TL89_PREIN|nr:hypothetical protein CBG55_00730 [Prevotella intermedia]PJI24702.1 hypothetical protein CTM59_00745 [Prevotella intermedia]